jgi:hypothetical protein
MIVRSEKKQAVDFSGRRFIGAMLILLLTTLVVGVLVRTAFREVSITSYPASPVPMTAFSGGTFEASGVAYVPGTDTVLFVDDGRPNEVFLMQLGEDRKQTGAIKTINIATSIIDLEGITYDGEYFYVVGSQSKPTGADQAGLARFRFNAANQRPPPPPNAPSTLNLLPDSRSFWRTT